MQQPKIVFRFPGFPECEINITDYCRYLDQLLSTHPPLCLPCPDGSLIWEKFNFYLLPEDRKIELYEPLQDGWIIEARPAK